MSILRKASRWKLIAPSNTSGAIYLLVPTYREKTQLKLHSGWARQPPLAGDEWQLVLLALRLLLLKLHLTRKTGKRGLFFLTPILTEITPV